MSTQEFDHFASGYDAGMNDPLKRVFGDNALVFLQAKADVLLGSVQQHGPADSAFRYLDFGCGSGDFLHLIGTLRPAWDIKGCDISSGMIREAGERYPNLAARSCLMTSTASDLPAATFDIITAVCVFHHIPPVEWIATLSALRKALKPNGALFLFEHNPLNPLTRLIVRRAKIDENAILLSPMVARQHASAAGFATATTHYFLFMPPKWRAARYLDRALAWLPLGGQYMLRIIPIGGC